MFSAGLIQVIIGLSLILFGIFEIIMGSSLYNKMQNTSIIMIILGIISIILGMLFIFYINNLALIADFEFYIVGFIMIIFGITSLISVFHPFSKLTSVLILIIGIIIMALGVVAANQPIFIAILLGICLILEGISLILLD